MLAEPGSDLERAELEPRPEDLCRRVPEGCGEFRVSGGARGPADRRIQRFPLPRDDGDGLQRLEELVGAYLRNVGDRTSAARAFLRMWGEAVAGDPVLVPLFAERDASFRSYLADLVTAGTTDGSMRPDVDARAAAVLLLGLLRGIGMQLIATPAPTDVTEIVHGAVLTVRHAFAAPR